MLHFEQYVPANAEDGAPVVVLLHGRGSNEQDLMGLRQGFPANAIVVTPRAPFSGAEWGYGGGWAWYQFLGGTNPERESFEASVAAVKELIQALPDLLPVTPGPVIVGGFSQGGTTSLGFALQHPALVDGLLMFSGFLPSHPNVRATPETVAGTRFFWGHGAQDPMIPYANGVAGRAALAAAGADLTVGDYQIGHTISPNELRDAGAWLATFAASAKQGAV